MADPPTHRVNSATAPEAEPLPLEAHLQGRLEAWRLEPDGSAFSSQFGSLLAPVRRDGRALMLKIAGGPEEEAGAALMRWWGGRGAAEVIELDGPALLMERAISGVSLADHLRSGQAEDADARLCAVAERLHGCSRSTRPPDTLRPLNQWFRALPETANAQGGRFADCWRMAQARLSAGDPDVVLHGDLHHDNIMDFGERGWLAIDPKGLLGPAGYEFANLVFNPWPEAAEPARVSRRLGMIAARTGQPLQAVREWVCAYGGLSAAWTLQSGGDPGRALAIIDMVRN